MRRKPGTHCKQGHEMTEANTYIDTKKVKICRICRKESVARNTARTIAHDAYLKKAVSRVVGV